ncbi:hypothetical protein ASA1KI_39680 [Opitutales bacterium ASA1]|uniref:helix-turn-helix transcriptional regulator n=1 Tax=Congregicoccus parvus TaxID=3081749 RepID=UPI002B2925EA|nr:hypothetical protein ASA1KI_39680 [Opitutales bacterium ASA1]
MGHQAENQLEPLVYTMQEVCQLLRTSYMTLYRLEREGVLRPLKHFRREKVYLKSSVQNLLEEAPAGTRRRRRKSKGEPQAVDASGRRTQGDLPLDVAA